MPINIPSHSIKKHQRPTQTQLPTGHSRVLKEEELKHLVNSKGNGGNFEMATDKIQDNNMSSFIMLLILAQKKLQQKSALIA